ncbi:hypothetical protein CHQ84_04800 [Francisella noatunensis subsp. orientalis]|uniref:Uncharacterized protein n=1 Tax=Francisella orientalis TaxID=299583 RepID=A0AAW9YPW6_9GAMM|nr:hypothetical protein [Francisella orientalis]NIB62100.1 hypothetical protein [Francisella orientalis]NIB65600.1 hypothetical protein [Francisella orientalis]NIY50731.1 hypothetical protein [Francisella orientalis]NIY52181.1 hypothetical protein [Francisella orientalis]
MSVYSCCPYTQSIFTKLILYFKYINRFEQLIFDGYLYVKSIITNIKSKIFDASRYFGIIKISISTNL